ncbi:MAG TPA: Panacea domain-containing protein [Solirubrobacterales bacterium]|nr:Panacea domain-containing protein [Solirubrobacterales bacterium]
MFADERTSPLRNRETLRAPTRLSAISDAPVASIDASLMTDPSKGLPEEFNHERFEALVLYIAWRTRDDPGFGRTKLAKALFYSDLAIYADTGKPLTGAVYVHRAFGPFPPELDSLEEKVHKEDTARAQRIEAPWDIEDDRESLKILPRTEPSGLSQIFEEWDVQRHVVDSYIDKISRMGSWKVSDDSDKHPGWLMTAEYEEIPYHAAFMSRRKPTDRDRERIEKLAREHGWP